MKLKSRRLKSLTMRLIRWVEQRITGRSRSKSKNKEKDEVALPRGCGVLDLGSLGAGEHFSSRGNDFAGRHLEVLGSPFRPLHHSSPHHPAPSPLHLHQPHIRTSFLDQLPVQQGNTSDISSSSPLSGVYSPRPRSRIRTNPWISGSQNSSCCSSSTSADSGAWTATSSGSETSSVRRRLRELSSTPESMTSESTSIYFQPSYPVFARVQPKIEKPPVATPTIKYPASAQPRRKTYKNNRSLSANSSATPHRSSSCHRSSRCRTPNSYGTKNNYCHVLNCSSSEDEAYFDDYSNSSRKVRNIDVQRSFSAAGNEQRHNFAASSKIVKSTNYVQNRPLPPLPAVSAHPAIRTPQIAPPERRVTPQSTPLRNIVRPVPQHSRSTRQATHEQRVRQERLQLQKELLEFRQYLLMRSLQRLGENLNNMDISGFERAHFI